MSKQKSWTQDNVARNPFRFLQDATRVHRREHGCGAYTFEDGAGLADLSARFRPNRILELGTALGYTACCLASGSPLAHVDTIERDPLHVELARLNIASANLASRITVHEGDFSEVLPRLAPNYNLAFFDGFAPDLSVMNLLAEALAPEGVLVCANLALAPAQDAGVIRSILGDPKFWRPLQAIEAGATSVWLKL
jgi:predicted O-methyltransferase YrrM